MSVSNFEELKHHVGHRVVCIGYGKKGEYVNAAIECEDCNEVLVDFDKYPEEEDDE